MPTVVERVRDRSKPRRWRTPSKMALGIFVGLLAGAIAVAAFLFIWFGIFPSLVLLLLCVPLFLLAHHLMRSSDPGEPR